MGDCVILYRNNGGSVRAILENGEDDYDYPTLRVFDCYDDASTWANNNRFLQSVEYEIVGLTEI